ncbi:MAG: hypothetical protein JW717_14970 [Marinilabiliaceae bacterium]|nr:hypothetical protein [Marinilabiliaceae bacterium]
MIQKIQPVLGLLIEGCFYSQNIDGWYQKIETISLKDILPLLKYPIGRMEKPIV